MKAIILVGGKGERLMPLTNEIPKPLLPIKGKAIVEYILDNLKKNGVRDIILSVGYKKELFKEKYGDGSSHGLNIEYIEENEPLGTAGFLRLKPITETTLVINGDDIFELDLNEFLRKHKNFVESGAVATLSLVAVDDTESFGTVKLDGDRITSFTEKGRGESNLVSVGHYLIEPSIMRYAPDKKRLMFETDLFPKLASGGKLFSWPSSNKWIHIRDLNEYLGILKESNKS